MKGAKGASLIVAASIGAVEALKDQLGVCRWNYALRLIQQRTKTSVRSYYRSHIVEPAVPSSANKMMMVMRSVEKIKKTEQSVKKVMDLNCWGPSTIRF